MVQLPAMTFGTVVVGFVGGRRLCVGSVGMDIRDAVEVLWMEMLLCAGWGDAAVIVQEQNGPIFRHAEAMKRKVRFLA